MLTSSVSLLRLMPRSALRLFYSRSPTIGFATALLFQRRGFDEAYLKRNRPLHERYALHNSKPAVPDGSRPAPIQHGEMRVREKSQRRNYYVWLR